MVNRNVAPVLGAKISPYLQKGEWQVGATFRTFRADKQYLGTRLSPTVTPLKTNVISKLQVLDLSGTYGVDDQSNVTLGLPITLYASSSRALPATVEGSPRFVQSAKGLGDITLVARRWVLDTRKYREGNLSVGLGVKLPSGDSNARDLFPNGRGQDIRLRPVDPSIQLGDGGVGLILDLQGFVQVGSLTFFASGTYLANPKGETDTPSPRSFLNPNGPSAVKRFERFNTVPDQFSARVGATHPVPGVKGLSLLLAVRIEGQPVEDLFGRDIGFRRPGYAIAVEPGLLYTWRNTTLAVSVPVTTQANVQNQLPLVTRESTFADVSVIVSVTHRIGRGN